MSAVEPSVLFSASSANRDPRSSLQDFRFPLAGPSEEQQPQQQQQTRQSSTQPSAPGQQFDDTSGSTSNTTSESSSRPSLTRSASNGRPRLPVLATVGKSRTKPHLPRRKSSTPKSPSIVNPPKSPKESLEKSGTSQAAQETSSVSLVRPTIGEPSSGLIKTTCKCAPSKYRCKGDVDRR